MLRVGNPVFLLIPSPSKKRILHPGEVIESDSVSFVGKFEDALTPAVDSDVNAFCEVNGKFFQQGAIVSEFRPEQTNVIAFRRNGEPVSAEARQTYRVSVINADFSAKVSTCPASHVLDISPEGFSAILRDRLNLGAVVNISLIAEGKSVITQARVQTLKERSEKEFRYGFLIPRANIAARNAFQSLSAQMQRLQLKRLRGAA
jgi:hypothetical protein